MAKSKWKLNFYNKCIFKKKFLKFFFNKKTNERFLYFRNSTVSFFFLNRIVRIHKGNYFNFVLIDRYSIGFKFGEFSVTKKPFHYPLKKKKK